MIVCTVYERYFFILTFLNFNFDVFASVNKENWMFSSSRIEGDVLSCEHTYRCYVHFVVRSSSRYSRSTGTLVLFVYVTAKYRVLIRSN